MNKNLVAKIIFLDFDGPLSNGRVTLAYGDNQAMDPVICRALNHICEASGAKIVCTSTRAVLAPGHRDETMHCFEQAGLDIRHVHHDWSCNDDNGGNRYRQIEQWLARHPETTHYAVVDDERVIDLQKRHHPKMVKTSMVDGLRMSGIRRIADLLDFDIIEAFHAARGNVKSLNQFVLPFEPWHDRRNQDLINKRIEP